MKYLSVFIYREWAEWKRLVLGTMIVAILLFSLGLLQINRGLTHINERFNNDETVELGNIEINDFNLHGLEIRINKDTKQFEINSNGDINIDKGLNSMAFGYGISLFVGFGIFFGLAMFIGMFFYSDAIYKERSDNSTLFFRSLPVNDHVIILSKILAGALGVLMVSLGLGFIFFLFTQIVVFMIGSPLSTFVYDVISHFALLDFFWDLIVFEVLMLLWLMPVALFFMLVSSFAKSRPLFIAIIVPTLFSVAWQIVVGDATLIKPIFNVTTELIHVIQNEWAANPWATTVVDQIELLGDFTKYIFSLRTVFSILVSGAFYAGILHFYRKNLPTS